MTALKAASGAENWRIWGQFWRPKRQFWQARGGFGGPGGKFGEQEGACGRPNGNLGPQCQYLPQCWRRAALYIFKDRARGERVSQVFGKRCPYICCVDAINEGAIKIGVNSGFSLLMADAGTGLSGFSREIQTCCSHDQHTY